VETIGDQAHFTYASAAPGELLQGDVLLRTPELDQVLKEVHPHFFQKAKNLYFMILSQSCDLVRGREKTPYITIAPVRSLDAAIARFVAEVSAVADAPSDLPVLTAKSKTKLAEFLRRVINNNESAYFYLESAGTMLSQDCCAFLRLGVGLKIEHYDLCVNAKILQLEDNFQSKLGALIGQMYSRVATRDWDHEALETKIKGLLSQSAYYIPDERLASVRDEIKRSVDVNSSYRLTESELRRILSQKVVSKRDQVLARVSALATELKLDAGIAEKLVKKLGNDLAFQALTKG
jgi:hypothetical protein